MVLKSPAVCSAAPADFCVYVEDMQEIYVLVDTELIFCDHNVIFLHGNNIYIYILYIFHVLCDFIIQNILNIDFF